MIKSAIKGALHLHLHAPDAALYASIKDGGLGVTELLSAIPRITLKRIEKLMSCVEDTGLNAALSGPVVASLVARLMRISRPMRQREEWKNKLMEAPMLRGIEQAEEDPASNNWLTYPPAGWTGKDFIKAVHLRFNVLPTVEIPSNPPNQRRCRYGCNKVESLSHVLQQCPNTHWQRIARHNEIAKKVERHCLRHWPVTSKPHVRHPDGTLYKPDLAISKDANIIICDIGVNWEGAISLTQAHANKKRVYDNQKFLEAAAIKWPNKNITIEPLIIGARGIWPKANEPIEELLGINN